MPEEARKRGLGRGLSALMADIEPVESPRDANTLPIEKIAPNPDQPRRTFDEAGLEELAESIRARGLIQPIIVRRAPEGDGYQIVAGERRWRAAQRAQLHELPVVIREMSDDEVLEVAIIENVQRVDLNPLEEALGLQALVDRFQHTQEQVAQALGKSRSHVANMLRLLKLPELVREMLRRGELSMGHARALLTADDPVGLARDVIAGDLSVRETEKLAKGGRPTRTKRDAAAEGKDADTRALEMDLHVAVDLPVSIEHKPDGSGRVVIRYATLDELDGLCEKFSGILKARFAK